MKITDLAQMQQVEEQGVWMQYTGDVRLKIARWGNPAFETELQRVLRPHRLEIRHGHIDDEKALKPLLIPVMAKHILVGWEGFTDANDQPVPYSSQKAEEFLRDYPKLYSDVRSFANEASLFSQRAAEDSQGN